MLSIVNSPHPSCSDSNKDLDLRGDVSHDVQAHPSNFSIRKYVFKSRSKDIRSNWPFREQLLDLCMDNGMNDVLPPLECPKLEKFRYSLKNKTLVLDEGDSKDKASEPDSSSTLDSLVVLSSNKEQLKNKCESKDLESNSSIVSNYMSSNACPVCKSFTSSSNTTLNAHIDQCLSSTKSSMTREDAGLNMRAKVKKKFMVDIYKTANHCTLEDLDRRNGTNWAATLAFIIPANNVDHANDVNHAADVNNTDDVNYAKKSVDMVKERLGTKRTLPQLGNSREGNVGDIYVDSNGTKLLILSKCNDSSPVISNKNSKMKKHGKDLPMKKLISQPNNTKLLRNTILRRKINLGNELEHEQDVFATANKELNSGEGSHEYNESNEENNNGPLKLGHWVRSKRSNLTRKHSKKFSSDGSKLVSINPTEKLSVDHTQQNSENSNFKRTLINHSKSFKTAASPKFKAMKAICSTLNELDKRNTNSESANLISHSSTLESFSSRGSDLSKTYVDEQGIFFTGKCFKKRRSMLRCNNKRGGENDYNIVNSGSHDSTDNLEHSIILSSELSKCQEKNVHCVIALNKEMKYSISRNESQVELPIYNKSHCDDATNNEVVNRDIQISTDQPKKTNHHGECQTNTYSFQDPSHCITSDGDTCIENTQENSSMTSIRAISNDKDCNLFVEMESSVSRASTTPTISPSSPKVDDKIKDCIAREDHKAKLSPKAWESSCSCSEITNSNPFVKLPSFSSVNSGLESHTETVNLSQNQSTSIPILRLMGKDLVVSKQASMQNQSTRLCDEKEKFTCMGISNHAGFRSYNNNNIQYQYHPIHAPSHNYQIPVNHNQALPLPVLPQYHAREVISFNDKSNGDPMRNFTTLPPLNFQNSNIMPSQSAFSCFPSQNLYAPEVFGSTRRETSEGTHVYHSPSSLYFAPILR